MAVYSGQDIKNLDIYYLYLGMVNEVATAGLSQQQVADIFRGAFPVGTPVSGLFDTSTGFHRATPDLILTAANARDTQLTTTATPELTRVLKSGMLIGQTASVTIYTVTAAKTFYLKTLILSIYTNNNVSGADIRIRDGAGGSDKIPFLLPVGIAGTVYPHNMVNVNFDNNPIPFTTSVYVNMNYGATYSVSVFGYEV